MVQESRTAVYAFMENLFAKDFPGLLQLMAIILYMLVEIVRSSFTGRGDPSELCSCTSLPTKQIMIKQQSNDKASNYP